MYAVFSLVPAAAVDHVCFRLILPLLVTFVLPVSSARIHILYMSTVTVFMLSSFMRYACCAVYTITLYYYIIKNTNITFLDIIHRLVLV
jgi:hypothetical protein